MGEVINITPATIAEDAAIKIFNQPPDSYERLPEDSEILNELDQMASSLELVSRPYWVETSKGLSLPMEFDSDEPVRVIDFAKLTFEGLFACYSKVMIGRIIGGRSIRALCLTFSEVTLLPYFDHLPDEHLLFVPVHAVNYMDSTDKIVA
ncbi:MAG TPA: hypothetical protein VFN31_02250 [Candidatus Saccharimonadales bacterium]|nr:hypothetical protein [Candidatus Saccharimonadales bacterium]